MLSVITLGHVHTDDLLALGPHVDRREQLVVDVAPRVALADHRAEINRAVDAAGGDWLLIIRERERIDDALAAEIAAAMSAAKAWGFRIRTVPLYAGKPLRLGDEAGEVRLFHRRHLLRRGDVNVQGTVIRLSASLYATSFASSAEHREYLAKDSVPHSGVRRALLFARYAMGARTLDRNTLRYLWIEAGFDR